MKYEPWGRDRPGCRTKSEFMSYWDRKFRHAKNLESCRVIIDKETYYIDTQIFIAKLT